MTIPRVLHRIWWNPPIPREFRGYGRAWAEINPGWVVKNWMRLDDEFGAPLTNLRLWNEAPANDALRWRSDLARLEILYRFGGVYVDMDIEPLRPIEDLVAGIPTGAFVATSANAGPGGKPVVSNAVIGAAPGHPFLRAAIATLPASVARFRGAPTAKVTGPWHLQRTIEAGHDDDLTILSSAYFYPQSAKERDRGLAPDLSFAYAWHKWANTRKSRP